MILFLTVSCYFPKATPEPSPTPPPPVADPFTAGWNDRSVYRPGLVPAAQPILDALDGASIYRIKLDISDDFLHLNGVLDVRYTNQETMALQEIHFRLFPNILGGTMQISNLRVGDAIIDPRYSLANSVMIAPLAETLDPGESIVIQMDFTVTVPSSLDINYGMFAYAEDVLTLAHSYPVIAVFDDDGWNEELPPQYADITFADASFYLVRVSVPRDVTLVTSGIEIARREDGQDQVVTVASGPARDFYLAASPAYTIVSQNFGDFTVRSFAPPEFEEGSQTAVEIAARALEIFSARYTPYPYTELDIVATPTRALGIEFPGAIVITSWVYDTSDPNIKNVFEATIAHEVGHQWFYNLIGNDQLDDPWLDESLTQFATLQYFLDEYGTAGYDGYRSSLESRWARFEYAAIPIGLPVAEYQSVEYSAIVYGRGPLFFEALKETMGAGPFDSFLREYATSISWEISTPETLRVLAEANCACDLSILFNEWVYRK